VIHRIYPSLFNRLPLAPATIAQLVLDLLVVLLLACGVKASAQIATGDILGSVTDPSGAAIPGASVRIENTGTRVIRGTKSNEAGAYTFTQVDPGTYHLTITMTGFKSFSTSTLALVASDRARVDASLTVGSSGETIEVTSQVSALQTDSTNVGANIDSRAISDLPLNGRNVYNLVQVSPGVNAGAASSLTSGQRPDDRRQSSSVSANGQYELVNNNLVDGLDNNERFKGLILLRPSVEAIQSVRVDINTYTAEVGRTAGAAIAIITKSGSNQFHGSAYEFLRNDITDARNYFSRPDTLPRKPELRQNQFGGSIGGPIFKDRTFFFADLEEFRQVDGNSTVYISSVPTTYEIAHPGDLSDVGGPVLTNLDPTAKAYFSLYPAPNQPTNNFAPGISVNTNNYFYNPARTQNATLGDLRMDQHFRNTDTLFVRYSYNKVNTFMPGQLPAVNGVQPGGTAGTFPGLSDITTHNGQAGYTHTFTPNLLMDLRLGYTLFQDHVTEINAGANLNTNTPYSIPNANQCLQCDGLAPVSPGGWTSIGDGTFLPILLNESAYQYAGSLTWTHGNHTVKAGEALIRRLVSNLQQNMGKPSISFTGANPQAQITSFFHGTPFNYAQQGLTIRPHVRTWEESAYIQDDWRVFPSLTLNLGMRYDIFTAPNEENGYFSNLNLDTAALVIDNTGGVQTNHANLAPRIGFAKTFNSTLVVRGGFGMSFYANDVQNAFYLQNPPYAFATGTITSTSLLSQGVAPAPTASSTTALSGAVWSKPFLYKNAYVEQFNLLLQKDISGNVFTVGYVGELGRHLNAQISNYDLPAPQGPVAPGTPAPAFRYAAQLPNVNQIQFFGSFAVSSYNSLQTSYERRLSSGLTVNANYTWAHTLDNTNNQGTEGDGGYGLQPALVSTYDYGNSVLDLRHRIAGTANYAIPFKGKSAISRTTLGGWQLNTLVFWQTGLPFAITDSVTQNGRAYINLPTVTQDRPDRIGNPNLSHPSPLFGFLNPGAFARQQLGTAGNAGRNIIHGPHQRRADMSLFKTFPIHEALALQLRAECFNLSNTPSFAQPNANISAYSSIPDTNGRFEATSAGGFGTITSTAAGSTGRQFQFAAKLTF
jgi:hypothetical protein